VIMDKIAAKFVLICISLALIGIIRFQSSAEVSPRNVVGMWLFDEGLGNMARDSCDKGNDGEIIGNAQWVAGKYGQAIKFDGETVYVEVPNNPTLQFGDNTNFTVMAWFKTTAIGQRFIMSKTVTPWVGFEVKLVDGAIRTCLQTLPATVCDNRGSGVNNGEFRHVAVVFDRTDGIRKVYVDGEQQGDPINQENVTDSIDNDRFLAIGVSGGDLRAASFFDGVMDEVALFNIALSDADIQSLMQGLTVPPTAAVSPSGNLTITWGKIKT
jgi:hypothetical protein